MPQQIDPIDLRLAQLLEDEGDFLAQAPAPAAPVAPTSTEGVKFTGNAFEDILAKAIDSLEGISQQEIYANELVDKYLKGEVELQDVMVAQAKISILVQLAVTTITSAVSTFKEITQMQV